MQSEVSEYTKGASRGMEGACYTVKSLARSVRLKCGGRKPSNREKMGFYSCTNANFKNATKEKLKKVLPFFFGLVVLIARWIKQGTN
jgi:hypothetical protein